MPSPSVRIFVAREAVDMRMGFDGLSGVVIHVIDEDRPALHDSARSGPRAASLWACC